MFTSSSSPSSTSSSQLSASKSPKSSPDSSGDTQKFYSHGKRIPKDVKRHCGMCKQHGILVETRGHTCDYKNCDCERCQLVRRRREIMSTQIRLRREQDKKFQRTTDIKEANVFPGCAGGEADEKMLIENNVNMCYFCQKCKNHNILVWKKNHKKGCQFTNCECEQCSLIDSRRALDRHIKKRRISGKDEDKPEKNGCVSAPKSPKKEAMGSFSSLTSSGFTSEEGSSSSECSLSGLLSEKLTVAPQVQMKFDFSTGSFLTPSCGPKSTSRSPVTPLLETSSPLLLPNSPVPMVLPSFLTVPSLITSTCSTPFFPTPFVAPPLLSNPFLMPLTPIDMQMLFQNIQNLTEMAAAVSVTNKD